MRICIDLDGTIASNKVGGQDYSDVVPISGAVDTLTRLRSAGAYIIIHTARNMNTYDNNLGLIIANQAGPTIEWLNKWKIPYDELLFGKPNVDVFIDDKGLKFDNWLSIESKLESMQNV